MKFLALVCLLLPFSSAHAEGLSCEQVLQPNVSGSAEVSVPKITILLKGDSQSNLATSWNWENAPFYSLNILAFENNCADPLTACSVNENGRIEFVTQYSGGENQRAEGSFDPSTKQLHLKFSESGFLFRKVKADILLQCQ